MLARLAINDEYADLAAQHNLLPVKVTEFYQRKIDAECAALKGRTGPLTRGIYPVADKLSLHAPTEIQDWVGDYTNANNPSRNDIAFIQKYQDRVLFLPTKICAAHCMYCFRQDMLSDKKQSEEMVLRKNLNELINHLHKHPKVEEVILSGGDPLTLSAQTLEIIFAEIKAVQTVRHLRVHSRAPVFAPQTLKQNKIDILAKYNVRLYLHVIHPYEICADVENILARLIQSGVRVYNHFPLLRQINDHPDVLLRLIRQLDAHGVQTLSIYVPEPIPFSAAYRISFDRMCAIIDAVLVGLPSWLQNFRFCLDSPHGKLRRENLVTHDKENNQLVFMRAGQKIHYPDFPVSLDTAGQLQTLLWKN